MSDKPEQSETPPPPPGKHPPGDKPSGKPPAPGRRKSGRRGIVAPLVLLLALVALAAVAFGGWQWWQGRQGQDSARQATSRLDRKVTQLEKQLASVQEQMQSGQKQAEQSLETARQALGQQVGGLSQRVGSLEDAVASLARHRRHGREAALLDQAGMLLRLGQQRYELFHDADGAVKAYAQAGETLAAANDPELGGVLRALRTERKALEDSHPATRAEDLAMLASLREAMATLPLKPSGRDQDKGAAPGFWQRVRHGLATAVVVRRDDGTASGRGSAQLTRQLAALDVAQAQAACLAWDFRASHEALQKVAARLDAAFDSRDAGVRKARAGVAKLLQRPVTASKPQLGKALHELGNLRDVRGVGPDDEATAPDAPAPASTASSPAEAST